MMWMHSRTTARRWFNQSLLLRRSPTERQSQQQFRGVVAITNNNPNVSTISSNINSYNNRSYSTTSVVSSTMELIKDLRSTSGAPIVDCKKALANTNNDLKAALDWLREHGAAKVTSKVGDREAKEGLIGLSVDPNNQCASLVQVSSETDFAGRSDTFVNLVTYCANAALANPNTTVTTSDLLEAEYKSKKVQDVINDAIVSIRENVAIQSIKSMTCSIENGVLVGYVHGKVLPTSNAGTAAAIVELAPTSSSTGNVSKDVLLDVGKKLAMHVVAAKPQYLNPESVPEDVIENEKQILRKQVEESKKPPDIVEKIVTGRLNKFYETVCLSHQAHMIEEGNPKVTKFLKEQNIELKGYELISIV